MENQKHPEKKKQLSNWAKYSTMAIQMGITIGAGTYLGNFLDEKATTSKPYYTVAFSLISVFAALYLFLKDLIRKN